MDIVVVGGAGFIGTNLVEKLIDLKHNVIVIDNYVSGNKSNHIEGAYYFDSDCRKWFGLKYSICYFYNNYGPYQDSCNDGWETVISIFEKLKRKGLPLSIVSPGTQRRNYTHVEDTVEGLIAAWKREENDEYQLGSSESFSMFELADLFECEYNFLPARLGDRMDSHSDLEDTYEKLNWKPKHKLKNWINEL